MKRFGLLLLLAALILPAVTGCSSDSMSSQITLTTSKSSIPADGATTAEITATILGYDGEPVPIGTSVHFTTSRGLFTNGLQYLTLGTTDATGTVKVYLYAPLKTTPGNANVTCQSNDVTRSVTVEITLYGPPGETAKIVLEADPDSIPADGATPSEITATLTDGNEDPVNIGTEATFTTDKGEFQNGSMVFTDVTRDTSGTIIAYLIAPVGTKAGPAAIECTSNGVTAQTTVMIGATITLTATASPTSIPADGATTSKITATVRTSSGTVMPGVWVKFETGRGEFSHGKTSIDVITNSSGVAEAFFFAPIGTQTGPCQITVTANGVSVQVVVTITAPGATPTPTPTATPTPTS